METQDLSLFTKLLISTWVHIMALKHFHHLSKMFIKFLILHVPCVLKYFVYHTEFIFSNIWFLYYIYTPIKASGLDEINNVQYYWTGRILANSQETQILKQSMQPYHCRWIISFDILEYGLKHMDSPTISSYLWWSSKPKLRITSRTITVYWAWC